MPSGAAIRADHITVVVIGNKESNVLLLASALKQKGVQIRSALDAETGLVLSGEDADIVVTEMAMPSLSGMEVLSHLRTQNPNVQVVISTANYSADFAVRVILAGAADCLCRPLSISEIRERVARIVGEVRGDRAPRTVIERLGPHFQNILLLGGPPEDMQRAARTLYDNSPVSDSRFFSIDCSTVGPTIDSQLFGHLRGSFAGATEDYTGLVEKAHGGVLFLEAIETLSIDMQAALAHLLRRREYLQVGSLSPRRVNVRVIASLQNPLLAGTKLTQELCDLLSSIRITGY